MRNLSFDYIDYIKAVGNNSIQTSCRKSVNYITKYSCNLPPYTMNCTMENICSYPPYTTSLSSHISKTQVWYTFTEHKVFGMSLVLVPVRLSVSSY